MRRLLLEPRDPVARVADDDAVQRRVRDLLDRQRGDAAVALVRGDERGEIDVGEAVAADHDEGAAGEEVAEGAHAAGRTEKLRLDVVGELHPEPRAVAEVGADLVRMVVQVGRHLTDAVAA